MASLTTILRNLEAIAPGKIISIYLRENPRIEFTDDATEQEIAACQAVFDNRGNIEDPNFDGMITELVFGSSYPTIQAWYNALPRTQSGFLGEQLGRQNLERIQLFFTQVDTTAIASELTALLAAFHMPITLN